MTSAYAKHQVQDYALWHVQPFMHHELEAVLSLGNPSRTFQEREKERESTAAEKDDKLCVSGTSLPGRCLRRLNSKPTFPLGIDFQLLVF